MLNLNESPYNAPHAQPSPVLASPAAALYPVLPTASGAPMPHPAPVASSAVACYGEAA